MFRPTDLVQRKLEGVCEALGVAADTVTVLPLSGGLLRRSYRLSSAAGDWAVRLPADAEDRYRLALPHERRLLETLAEAGLTASLASPDTGDILVTEFLAAASTWASNDAREPRNIARIAARLKELHSIDNDLPPFSATSVADDYCRLAAERHRLNSEQREWMQQFLDLANDYDAASVPVALCHHDLVASNILDDGELWFIDFEYAVRAEPLLDLASLASMNDFSTAEQDCLLQAYYGSAPPPFSMTRFAEVVRLLRLQSYFWALSSDGPEYEDEAIERFVEDMAAVLR